MFKLVTSYTPRKLEQVKQVVLKQKLDITMQTLGALVVKLVDTKDLKTIDTIYASEKSTLA